MWQGGGGGERPRPQDTARPTATQPLQPAHLDAACELAWAARCPAEFMMRPAASLRRGRVVLCGPARPEFCPLVGRARECDTAEGASNRTGGGGIRARRAGAQRGGGQAEESGGGRAKGEVQAELREEGGGRRGAAVAEQRWKWGRRLGARRGRGGARRAPGGPEFRDGGLGVQWGGVVGERGGQDRVLENRGGEMRGHQDRLFDSTGA